jgi:endonuclease-3
MGTFTQKARRLDRVRGLLKRRYGEQPRPDVTHPVEHIIRTVLAEETTPAEVDKAVERLRAHFCGWNDLRVSRPREVREVLGDDFPRRAHKARVVTRVLDQVFKQHNSMVWDFLENMGKTETRQYFESLEEVRPFVAATMARDLADAHAFPVDRDVARVLGRLGILDPETEGEAEMQAFGERAVKSTRVWETHQLVRRLAEDLCIVENPKCPECPLKEICPSAQLPPKRKKKAAAKTKKKKGATGKAGGKKTSRKKKGGTKAAKSKTAGTKRKTKRGAGKKGSTRKKKGGPKAKR